METFGELMIGQVRFDVKVVHILIRSTITFEILSTFCFGYHIVDPRVLYGDVNMNAGSCTEGAPGCKCSWVKPEFKSCNYHIEGMGLISRVHGAGKEVGSCYFTQFVLSSSCHGSRSFLQFSDLA